MLTWLLVGFGVALIVDHFFFGMQRTTLLLSRQLGVSSETTAILLPAWYKLSLIPIIARWALLVAIAIWASWWLAIGLAVFAFVVFDTIAPIPFTLYMRYFKKRFDAISQELADCQASGRTLYRISGFVEQFPKFSAEARSLRRLALCDELQAALEIKRAISGAYSSEAHLRPLYQYLLEPESGPC
ncbi:MAG: hypothetical protein ACK4P3_05270 [Fimbriimonadaceae bacterium]